MTKPWKMLTWVNHDGTGKMSVRRYTTRRSAVRSADAIRARKRVAIVEHEKEKTQVSHWRQ